MLRSTSYESNLLRAVAPIASVLVSIHKGRKSADTSKVGTYSPPAFGILTVELRLTSLVPDIRRLDFYPLSSADRPSHLYPQHDLPHPHHYPAHLHLLPHARYPQLPNPAQR